MEFTTRDIKFKDENGQMVSALILGNGSVEAAVDDWLDNHPEVVTNTYVTPEMYGAKGDGVTDDTDALSACFSVGKPVDLCGKKYAVSGNLTLNNKVVNGGFVLVDDCSYVIKTAYDIDTVEIDGGDCETSYGILLANFNNTKIDTCYIHDLKHTSTGCSGIGIVPTYNSGNSVPVFTVANCIIANISSTENGTIGDSAGAASGILLYTTKIASGTIQDCKISSIRSTEDSAGITIQDGGSTGVNVNITSCQISDVDRNLIKAQAACTIENCVLDGDTALSSANYGIRFVAGNCSVKNTIIKATKARCSLIMIDSGAKPEHIAVENCYLSTEYGGAIELYGNNNKIVNNVIISNGQIRAVYNNGDNLIEGNVITSTVTSIEALGNTNIIGNKCNKNITITTLHGQVIGNKAEYITGTGCTHCRICDNNVGYILMSGNANDHLYIDNNICDGGEGKNYCIVLNTTGACNDCVVSRNVATAQTARGIVFGPNSQRPVIFANAMNATQDYLTVTYSDGAKIWGNTNAGSGGLVTTGSTNLVNPF